MRSSQILLFAIQLAVFFTPWVRCSFVQLTTQGYTNLVVKIDNDVPPSECQRILTNLNDLFTEASQRLCEATANRAFFGQASVIIPNSWTTVSECFEESNVTLSWPRSYKADVVLGQYHPQYGNEPFSLQYGGCGDESLYIRISVDFLSQPKRGIKFIHEWFHYRYGVFDESGVADDPLYPVGYSILNQGDNSTLPTSCTNVPTVGKWNESIWQMKDEDNTNVTSSLMYTTQLPNIKLPCSGDTHLKASPSKQNLLCNGKSVSEVMLSHQDFTSNKPLASCEKPKISIIGNPVRGYHLILDISSFMSESIEDAKFAISHFIWFLPDGLVVSLDSYGESYSEVIAPVTLNRTNANKEIEKVQRIQCQPSNSTAGLTLALNRAVDRFLSGMEIVLVTATTQPNNSDFAGAVDAFRSNLIAPHILALNSLTMKAFSALAREGGIYFIPDSNQVTGGLYVKSRRTWLTDTLHAIYSRTFNYRAKINEEVLVLNQERLEGTFHVDGSSGSLIFAFYELESIYAFEFIQGTVYSPSGVASPVSQGRSFELFRASCNISEAGTWSYSISFTLNSVTQIRLDIWMENAGDAIQIKTWTSSPAGFPVDVSRLVIYAFVTLGQRPISGVEIVARITGNNETQPLLLRFGEDNENDITLNDGVYSAILTDSPGYSTMFSYVLEIINSTGITSTGLIESHATAGSKIPLKNPTNVGTRFSRYEYGGGFHLVEPHNGRDLWPPGRVKDLKVTSSSWENFTFTLRWTAPKDDYATSSTVVYKHRITWEDDVERVEDVYFSGDLFPHSEGNFISYPIKLNATNQTRQVFMRVYGMDSEDNTGDASNIVTINITAKDYVISPDNDSGLPPALFWSLIGIGCATLVLIILVIAVLVSKRCSKQRKQDNVKTWIKHGSNKEGQKTVRFHPQEVIAEETSDRRMSNTSSWSSSVYSTSSNYSSDVQVIVHPVTIEKPHVNSSYSVDSDDESVVYAQPIQHSTTSMRDNVSVAASQKKRPPMPPPRRYFGITSTSATKPNEEPFTTKSSMPYTTPQANSRQTPEELTSQSITKQESNLRKKTIERYFTLLGCDTEASLV